MSTTIHISVTAGPDAGVTLPVVLEKRSRIVPVFRGAASGLSLTDPLVSRGRHASLEIGPDKVTVRRTGGTNGVRIAAGAGADLQWVDADATGVELPYPAYMQIGETTIQIDSEPADDAGKSAHESRRQSRGAAPPTVFKIG